MEKALDAAPGDRLGRSERIQTLQDEHGLEIRPERDVESLLKGEFFRSDSLTAITALLVSILAAAHSAMATTHGDDIPTKLSCMAAEMVGASWPPSPKRYYAPIPISVTDPTYPLRPSSPYPRISMPTATKT